MNNSNNNGSSISGDQASTIDDSDSDDCGEFAERRGRERGKEEATAVGIELLSQGLLELCLQRQRECCLFV